MDHSYLLVAEGSGLAPLTDRPTQEDIKQRGEGAYTLCRADGQALKDYVVVTNKRGNLQITASTPERLRGLSTLNLTRLVKYYERIVKIWPEQSKAVRVVQSELSYRKTLVGSAVAA